ncbi:MAG: hypothetical protein Q3979_10040 [Actinomycetaceae bacterium]|nr:hypothetical protein [Actinomycetaceae bacterium]
MNAKASRDRDTEQVLRDGRMLPDNSSQPRYSASPTSRLGIAGALAASLLAAASLTACSQSGNDQADPTNPTSSQSLETTDRQPADESDEPTDEDSTEPSDSSNAGYLCGGLLSEQFLKDELSFTPSRDKFSYWNDPPDGYSSGDMSCRIYDEADDTQLDIEYDSDTTSTPYEVEQAESNADGKWQPVTFDGQEGKGWVNSSSIYHQAVWVDADGYVIVVKIFGDGDGSRTVTADNLKALMENIVGTTPEHNETAGDVHESHG